MAFRTWAKLLGVTLGVAALAGACQLGLAYGLGILRLTRVLDVTVRDQWTAQLAWVAWFAMTAAVLGALAGRWMRDRWRAPATVRTFGALAVAAGVGAALVVPLTMQPARTARIDGVHPVFVIGLCAGLGAAVGIFAAYAALTQVVARWSLATIGSAIWVLALVSVAPSLAPDDPLPAVRLGVFDAGFFSSPVTQRAALFTMPALALVVGGLLGYQARRRDLPTLTIALAGLPGPALLTVSYLIAGPGAGPDRYQVVPYWAAMTATGAGVLGSVLAAVIRRGGEDQAETDAEASAGAGAGAGAHRGPGADGDEPTDRIPAQRPTAPTATATTAPGSSAAPPPGSPPRKSAQTSPPRKSPQASPPPATSPSPIAPPPAVPPAKKATRRPPRNTPPSADGETGELPTFNAFANPSRGRSRQRADPAQTAPAQSAPARSAPSKAATAKAEQPYVPAPALPEIPPEALQQHPQQQQPHRRAVNVDARPENLRGKAPVRRPGGTPMVPEPPAISPPLPHPEPVNKPLSVTPAPAPTPSKPRGRKQKSDDEYVDWVSKLGNES